WNFVLWGLYQGSLLCVYHVWRAYRPSKSPPKSKPAILILSFFGLTCYGWLLFRAHSLTQIVQFSSALVTDFGDFDYGAGLPKLSSILGIALLVGMELGQYLFGDANYYRRLI